MGKRVPTGAVQTTPFASSSAPITLGTNPAPTPTPDAVTPTPKSLRTLTLTLTLTLLSQQAPRRSLRQGLLPPQHISQRQGVSVDPQRGEGMAPVHLRQTDTSGSAGTTRHPKRYVMSVGTIDLRLRSSTYNYGSI